jgi:hypothetical protein
MLARALPCSALNASGSATRTAAVAPRRSPSPHRPTSPNPNDHAFATFRKREKRGGDRKRGGRREEGRVGGGRGKQAPRIHEAARVGIRRWRRWSCVCLSVGSGGELNDDGKATQLFLMEEPTERTGPFPPLARPLGSDSLPCLARVPPEPLRPGRASLVVLPVFLLVVPGFSSRVCTPPRSENGFL